MYHHLKPMNIKWAPKTLVVSFEVPPVTRNQNHKVILIHNNQVIR